MQKALIKTRLERYPVIYLTLLRLKRIGHWSRDWVVTRKSDVTIEGFPRSANSFALSAFRLAQPNSCCIATHVHSCAQILRSAQLGVPTMVLVRTPKDACLSLAALTYQIEETEISEQMEEQAKPILKAHLENYRTFYERIIHLGNSMIVADFNVVTSDYGIVIKRLNTCFGTNFMPYDSNPKNKEAIFKESGFHLSPDPNRNSIKEVLRRAYSHPDLRKSIERAENAYQKMRLLEREQAVQFDTT